MRRALFFQLALVAITSCMWATQADAPRAERGPTTVPTSAPEAKRARVPAPPPVPQIDPVDAAAEALRALAPDPAPPAITNDKHYLVSNERRLDLYRPDIDGLGGAFIGVGTDQNYILAGFIAPSLMVIVDFDQAVVDLHAIHGALLKASPDAASFLHLWSDAGTPEALAAIDAQIEDPARRRTLRALHALARPEVDARLRTLRKRYAALGIVAWLEDPEQFEIVRDLFVRDRVVAIRGDLTRDGVLQQIADVLAEHGQHVRVLYLSNVEQYVAYRSPWKRNMLALPLSGDSLVLRTLPGRPAGFQYILQRGPDFQAWMRAPKVWSVYRLRGLARGEHLTASERFFIEARPPAEDAPTDDGA